MYEKCTISAQNYVNFAFKNTASEFILAFKTSLSICSFFLWEANKKKTCIRKMKKIDLHTDKLWQVVEKKR